MVMFTWTDQDGKPVTIMMRHIEAFWDIEFRGQAYLQVRTISDAVYVFSGITREELHRMIQSCDSA